MASFILINGVPCIYVKTRMPAFSTWDCHVYHVKEHHNNPDYDYSIESELVDESERWGTIVTPVTLFEDGITSIPLSRTDVCPLYKSHRDEKDDSKIETLRVLVNHAFVYDNERYIDMVYKGKQMPFE